MRYEGFLNKFKAMNGGSDSLPNDSYFAQSNKRDDIEVIDDADRLLEQEHAAQLAEKQRKEHEARMLEQVKKQRRKLGGGTRCLTKEHGMEDGDYESDQGSDTSGEEGDFQEK